MKFKAFCMISILSAAMIAGAISASHTAGTHVVFSSSADIILLCCDGPAEVVCQ